MTPPVGPWTEHRDVAEAIAQAIAAAVGKTVGTEVILGIADSFNPEEMIANRPMPVRAIVVDVQTPLRDSLIFLASAHEDVLRPIVEAAVPAALGAIDAAQAKYTIGESVELDNAEWAVEQCDALYLEATYELPTPSCELRIVLGTGLLESANCHVNGIADPWVEGSGPSETVADDDIASMFTDGATPAAIEAEAAAQDASPIEDLDAKLAAAEAAADAILAGAAIDQAEAIAAAAPTIAAAEAAEAAAKLPSSTSAAAAAVATTASLGHSHWASLLSDVEVEISAELGRTDLPLGDITALIADSVLTLDQIVDEPVTVYVNGTAYAMARLVVVGGEYGIEILEVLPQAAALSPFATASAA